MVLSESVVVAAGVRRAVETGMDGIGMRGVATELGVTPMALYRHVGDSESLRSAVIDRLLAGMPEVSVEGTWDQRCRSWAHLAREAIVRVPGLARHVLLHWITSPTVLVALDGLVRTLEEEGPDGVDAVGGANALLTYVLMRAQAEEAIRTQGLERDLSSLRARRKEVPYLWSHRDEYRYARFDEHFAYGLDALLTGIATTRRQP